MTIGAVHADTTETPLPAAPSGVYLYPNHEELTLPGYLQRVIESNENVQARLLAFQAARSQGKAEHGIFEPAFVLSGEYVDSKKPNTIEIERSLQSGGVYIQQNQNYNAGLEFRTPFGSKIQLGSGLRRLRNNVQRTVLVNIDAEYETTVGLSIEQPLLKGFGRNATMASIRLAARSSEAAFQDYRRELMTAVAQAEMAYWTLHLAQAEYALSRESVSVARSLVEDGRARLDAGRGSKLDLLEAEAGLAIRLSRESAAQQKLAESMSRMTAFFAVSPQKTQTHYIAADQPKNHALKANFEEATKLAMAMSPELQKARTAVEQEKIRVAYAKNQRLPQLDLVGTAGSNGLGYDYKSSYKDIEKTAFPSWSVSLQLRVPIFGGVRERSELFAARHKLRQTERGMSALESDLMAGMDAALRRAESSLVSVKNYTAVVQFRKSLLEAQLEARDVGRLESRKVLEADQDLFVARVEKVQSEVDHQRAMLELQVMQGGLLEAHGLEIEYEKMAIETERWVKAGGDHLQFFEYSGLPPAPAPAPVPAPATDAPAPEKN